MVDPSSLKRAFIALLAMWVVNSGAALAETEFSGVAAGDMSANDAILWTRTVDPRTGQPSATSLTAQLAAEPEFRNILSSFNGVTDPTRAGTIKINATGLQSHTRYFYRFVAEDGSTSTTGQFTTAPADDQKVAVRFAFSGDAQGDFRPYPLVHRFGELKLDFFVFLGDTMYETASKGSPAAADPFTNPTQALVDYRRKYLENIVPVNPGGIPGLQAMFAAQGNYTLLDNHELGGGGQFVSGGAPPGDPPGKGVDATDPTNDANRSCNFINRTPGFAALLQAYLDFQPVRERRVAAPGDCRSDGTWQLFFAQRWGTNAIFINVDDRSYRDIQLTKHGGEDTGVRADNPARTMLGPTQLAWLERTLIDAQRQGITWKDCRHLVTHRSNRHLRSPAIHPLGWCEKLDRRLSRGTEPPAQIHRRESNRSCRLFDDRRPSESRARSLLSGRSERCKDANDSSRCLYYCRGPDRWRRTRCSCQT